MDSGLQVGHPLQDSGAWLQYWWAGLVLDLGSMVVFNGSRTGGGAVHHFLRVCFILGGGPIVSQSVHDRALSSSACSGRSCIWSAHSCADAHPSQRGWEPLARLGCLSLSANCFSALIYGLLSGPWAVRHRYCTPTAAQRTPACFCFHGAAGIVIVVVVLLLGAQRKTQQHAMYVCYVEALVRLVVQSLKRALWVKIKSSACACVWA